MDIGTAMEYLAGVALILIGVRGIHRALIEYHRHHEPVKSLARNLAISFFLFGIIGGIGVLLSIAIMPHMWVIQGTSITVGYLILASSTMKILRRLKGQHRSTVPRSRTPHEKLPLPSASIVESKEEGRAIIKAISEYTETPIFVIGRDSPVEWIKKTEIRVHKYLWLTRVEHAHAVNPSSLHVISESVEQFLRDNPGGVVYLEGIEYILFYVDFRSLAKFVFSLRDRAVLYGGHLVLLVSPQMLKPNEFAIFRKEFEEIDAEGALSNLMGTALFGSLSPKVAAQKHGEEKNAGVKGAQKGSGTSEEKTEEARPLRREEAAKEGR